MFIHYKSTNLVEKQRNSMLSVSTKGRYATRAMLELALRDGEVPVRLEDISKAQKISIKYLGRLMAAMVAAGLARSGRGEKRRFHAGRTPSKVRVLDILQAVEGPLAPATCIDDGRSCTGPADCVTRNVWMKLRDARSPSLHGPRWTTWSNGIDRIKPAGRAGLREIERQRIEHASVSCAVLHGRLGLFVVGSLLSAGSSKDPPQPGQPFTGSAPEQP
jgi:Rrf2 family transcriptional regulator, cysteine metabolism repressor